MNDLNVAFYSQFGDKLLADYLVGNPRTEAAILHALRFIPRGAARVLDIGCGIGWSSNEIKRHAPDATIVGVDLTPHLVDIAECLFEVSKLSFVACDITDARRLGAERFDRVIMLDIYEHIRKAQRIQAHRSLFSLLTSDGVVILTGPSIEHQQRLRELGAGLQPVDEDVSEDDVAQLARDIGGIVAYYRLVDIWHPGDYFHAAIVCGGKTSIAMQTSVSMHSELEDPRRRALRVESRLGVRALCDRRIVAARGNRIIAVVAPERNAYSETFIRAHMSRLPARVVPLHGDNLATLEDENGLIAPSPTLRKHIKESIARRLERKGWNDFQRAHIRDYLVKNNVDAVLAEYGPTGVMMKDVCLEANIPLIVHFHGFDAYRSDTLMSVGRHYPELFRAAAAIIAVSHDMEQELLKLGVPAEKLHLNPYGVDVNQFKGAHPAESSPHFVAIGRFVDKKAPLLTLLAFARVRQVVPEAHLTMAGDGPLLEASRQLANALEIGSAVRFSGILPPAEIATILQQARAFVQHSVRPGNGDSEGTPVAVLEACAPGLPVVATRHAGIKDVILDGETGLLADEYDVEGMAQHMIRLAQQPELADRLGRAGRQRVAREYDMEKSIANLWQIIDAAIV